MRHEHIRAGILAHCLEPGGAQKMAMQVSKILEQTGLQIRFLVLEASREDWKFWETFGLRASRFTASRLPSGTPTWVKISAAPWQYLCLQKYLIKHKIDVLLSFEDRANMFNLLLLRPSRRILAIRHPMISVEFLKEPVKRILIRMVFRMMNRRATCFVFNAKESLMEFARTYQVPSSKLRMVYNCIDFEQILAKAQVQDSPSFSENVSSRESIVACGRFKPVKGFYHLIRSFRRVANEDPDVRLLLVGDGPERMELDRLTRALGLQKEVIFAGLQKNPYPWLARSTLFVLSSLSEGFPNVLLEAMALGIPVISTDCTSGPREILAPETNPTCKTELIEFASHGILTRLPNRKRYPPEAPLDLGEEAMARAILTLLRDEDLRRHYAVQARQRAMDFSCHHQAHNWLDLLDDYI